MTPTREEVMAWRRRHMDELYAVLVAKSEGSQRMSAPARDARDDSHLGKEQHADGHTRTGRGSRCDS